MGIEAVLGVCLVCAGSRVYRRGQRRCLSAWVVLTPAKQLSLQQGVAGYRQHTWV